MNRLHTSILTGGLLLSPVLITVEELIRTTADTGYVENEADPVADASSHLQVVADHLTLWHAAAYLNLAFLLAWAIRCWRLRSSSPAPDPCSARCPAC